MSGWNQRAARVLLASLVVLGVPVAASGANDVMRLHFIDVGQGAATLIEFPCAAVLIDTGGERWPSEEWKPAKYDSTKELVRYLDAFFAGRPDLNNTLAALILTHPHKDHTRGVSEVVERYDPQNVVHNGQSHGSGIDEQNIARDHAKDNEDDGVSGWYVLQRTIDPQRGLSNQIIDPVTCAATQTTDPSVRVLWGQVRDDNGWDPHDFGDENNHSVVVRVDYGEASVLFTGDLEEGTRGEGGKSQGGIERLLAMYKDSELLDVDVYHVGHHGSHNGTTPELVSAMSPEIAVISAGPVCRRKGFSAWSHGHPRSVTVSDLVQGVSGTRPSTNVKAFPRHRAAPESIAMTKAIYSTGWDGTIVLEGKADGSWNAAKTTGRPACLPGE